MEYLISLCFPGFFLEMIIFSIGNTCNRKYIEVGEETTKHIVKCGMVKENLGKDVVICRLIKRHRTSGTSQNLFQIA